MNKIFLLSPAHSGGQRAQLIFNPPAGFDLARRLRAGEPISIGEIFTFLSGLYFRGKLACTRAFAAPPGGLAAGYVITTSRGLMPVESPLSMAELKTFPRVSIDTDDPRYSRPLLRDAANIAAAFPECRIVLPGSISTGKYVDVLSQVFGDRLHFPVEFVGRGDMSRGGLMLRCAASRKELEYAPVAGTIRRGKRPPKLAPVRRTRNDADADKGIRSPCARASRVSMR